MDLLIQYIKLSSTVCCPIFAGIGLIISLSMYMNKNFRREIDDIFYQCPFYADGYIMYIFLFCYGCLLFVCYSFMGLVFGALFGLCLGSFIPFYLLFLTFMYLITNKNNNKTINTNKTIKSN